MTQPRLKIGDTFVYTKEMNKAKIEGSTNNMDASEHIGKKLIVASTDVSYSSTEDRKYSYNFEVIDPFLPPKPRTLDDVKEGDVLVDKAGLRREVLGRLGQVIFVDWDEDSQDDGVINCVSYSLGMVKKHLKFADQPEERWKPEEDERFWFVNSAAKKNSSAFGKCWDHEHEIGNCFKTEAEAQQAAEELKEFWRGRINNQK